MKQRKYFKKFKNKLKNKSNLIIFLFLTVFLFSVYQNCAQTPQSKTFTATQYPSGTDSSLTNGIDPLPTPTATATPTSTVLTLSASQYTFSNATGNSDYTITVSNNSAYPAYYVQSIYAIDLSVFTISSDTCSGISLPTGQNCQIKVNFTNNSTNPYSGFIYVAYQNANYVSQNNLAITMNGPAGNSSTVAQTVAVYRFAYGTYTNYNTMSKHFYTLTYSEGINAGYQYEGVAFHVVSNSGVTGTVPLYRCRIPSNGTHFISTSSSCEGQTSEGTYGYIYTGQATGTYPLYRYYSSSAPDHFYLTGPLSVLFNGYVYESITGYVLP